MNLQVHFTLRNTSNSIHIKPWKIIPIKPKRVKKLLLPHKYNCFNASDIQNNSADELIPELCEQQASQGGPADGEAHGDNTIPETKFPGGHVMIQQEKGKHGHCTLLTCKKKEREMNLGRKMKKKLKWVIWPDILTAKLGAAE